MDPTPTADETPHAAAPPAAAVEPHADPDHVPGHEEEAPIPGSSWFNSVLAVFIAALFGAGVYSASIAPSEERGGHEHAGLAEARYLREEAAKLAEESHWPESLEKLAEAKKIDPHGDTEEAIQNLRRLDEQKLRSAPPHEAHEKAGAHEAKPGKGEGQGHADETQHEAPHEAPHEGR